MTCVLSHFSELVLVFRNDIERLQASHNWIWRSPNFDWLRFIICTMDLLPFKVELA